MDDVSNSDARNDALIEVPRAADVPEPARQSKWYRWRKDGTALIRYLLDSEVHTFAFSVAANAILSFIPFIALLYALSDKVFNSAMMKSVVIAMVIYFFPVDQDFMARNLPILASHVGVQLFSLIMILVACTGIFLPLEVALNQAWGVTKSRNYLHNQVIAFGLAILMVVLGMGSIMLNAAARDMLTVIFVHNSNIKIIDFVLHITYQGTCFLLLAVTTGVASILFFFAIYWLLPNRKVPWRHVMSTSIYTGVIWLVAKYIVELLLPHMHLIDLYGPFHVSVGLLFWAYTSGLILFAGAQFSVARLGGKKS
ncbi:MAG TPA: YihY/virulence factor BrkB family protein [Terracidiphilus sp.]|nr:YihY/virulence factor BrkB family protein [Terracidiphilus sp.]